MAKYSEKNTLELTTPNLQASFSLLNKYRNHMKRLRNGLHTQGIHEEACTKEEGNASNSQELSAVTIMRMAGMVLSTPTGDFSCIVNSFGIPTPSENHLKKVLTLLGAAENFSKEEYDQSEELLVSILSSGSHPIERVMNCYARYLRQRIDVKKHIIDLEREIEHLDIEEAMIDLRPLIFACEQKLPLTQISNFAAIQTILDSFASAERIHFIDIGKKLCSYWIVMMHALANRERVQVKKLKITAVCTPMCNVREAGKLLSSFAESMRLPFVFKALYTENYELEKAGFEIEPGEKVAVFMDHNLRCLSAFPKRVDALLRGIKNINPHLMIVIDVEQNFRSSTFSERFRGALSLSSAVSDSLEICLRGENHSINTIEKIHFHESICNGVLSENEDSFDHHHKIDFWREYFSKFGILETEMSKTSMYQARLMIEEKTCWTSCSLTMNGKGIILCWKGISLRFLSAWKFQQEINTEEKITT